MHRRIVQSAAAVVEQPGTVGAWGLCCFSMFIEAACLYDRVALFDPHPMAWTLLFLESPALQKQKWISVHDCYRGEEERSRAIRSLRDREQFEFGRMLGAEFLDYPAGTYTRNERYLEQPPEEAVLEAMALMGKPPRPDFWDFGTPEYRLNFHRMFAASKVWQIEAAREVREAVGAQGLFLPPHVAPFWEDERRKLKSALQANFDEAQEVLLKRITPDEGLEIDVSPLTMVALDTSLTRERLWETIFQMRKDYAELRTTARKYAAALAEAERYEQIAEVMAEWRGAWEGVLKKIAKPQGRLLQRLFGWDVLKKGTLKGIVLAGAEVVGSNWRDVSIEKGLTVVRRFESELFFARPVARRIEALFGGYRED